ncbi:MAG: rod shape-determining protein RodA [Tissierellia bacterium]|nr:rod shape-determining protein RodA [Tissierellia bacterium]
MINIRNKSLKDFDWALLITTLALCIYGLIVLSSAASGLKNYDSIMKSQIAATVLGFVAIFFLTVIDYDIWGKLYIPIYFICIGLLIWTIIKGVSDGWGAKSWVTIPGTSFGIQPSEIVKIGLIISLSKMIDKNKENLNEPFVLLKVLAFGFFPVALIMLQPDLGTALVFTFFIAIMLFVAGIKWQYIGYAVMLAFLALPIAWNKMEDYQKNRILGFFDPTIDALGSTYQINQSKIALASGQLTGRGLYQGVQTQYKYLPTRETDFIFSALSEELGFIGGVILITLYFILIFRLIKIAMDHKDSFGSYMCMGFMGMFLFHIWENIGMNIGVMPVTGIPLPFVSQGGTFQLICLIAIGIALSVSIHMEDPDYKIERKSVLIKGDSKQ